MKKVFFLLAVAIFTAMSFAQEREKTLKQYGYWDNWFLQLQMGGQYTFSECQTYSSFSGKLSPTAALNVGKFFSPEIGSRFQIGGWTSKNNIVGALYNVTYINANLDVLFNMSNIFRSYRENRGFNLVGILGVGFVHTFKNQNVFVSTQFEPQQHTLKSSNSGSIRLGLQADIRLSDAWSFNIEANGNLLRDDFNGQEKWKTYNDATLNFLAGFTYRFKNRGFVLIDPADPILIQSLNERNNELRGEIQILNNQNKELREQLEGYKVRYENKQITETEKNTFVDNESALKDTVLISVIVFRTGKSTIETDQEFNLYTVAQYMMKYREKQVTIASYTDVKASTADINLQVSKKRAAAVIKVLSEKYNIPANRFIIINFSGNKQSVPINNIWNKISVYTFK
ncbi:Outer membrane protein beta-barrel domain-containing protein [Bacteroides luti]|uniref:Outer membrane protein beta-barrel domain-containing protein n=1 Tax=Bacteroides luti TaxID=1297750 RepID=A0A1M5EAR2_9BACE|nr:OmpA family protein [Bacteroides luti]SHF76260.1 Outer membrane protein beta-barrel domain-containing protein [Bacteroides luti]